MVFRAIQSWDNRILCLVQERCRCSFLDRLLPVFTHMGTVGLPWFLASAAMLCLPHYRRSGIWLLITIVLCVLVGNFSIKPLVARSRPCHQNPDVPLLIQNPRDYSFPSCHTLSSFACSLVIALANPVWGIAAFVIAFFIAFSRIYLFVHYPSDVLAGAVMGLLMPWSALLLVVRVIIQVHRRRRNKAAY